ncbi:MAG: hypothetical protein E6R13_04265 [Spirochaetes bacterium]|nr:MAG: hypothetical protein E6R13_04265 [Spirochaetota bacterium]
MSPGKDGRTSTFVRKANIVTHWGPLSPPSIKNHTLHMEWLSTHPDKPGKYLVVTRTMMGNINRIEATWNGKSWSFTNQVFVKYLKE